MAIIKNLTSWVKSWTKKIIENWKKLPVKQFSWALKSMIETRRRWLTSIEKMDDQDVVLKIQSWNSAGFTNWDIAKFWLFWLVIAYVGYTFFASIQTIYLVLTALILSMAMETTIELFTRIFRKRAIAIVVSYLLFLTFFLAWILLLVPFLVQHTSTIVKHLVQVFQQAQITVQNQWVWTLVAQLPLPGFVKDMINQNLNNPETFQYLQNSLNQNLSQIVQTWSKYVSNVWSVVVNILQWIFSWLFQIILVIIMAIFFSVDKNAVVAFLSSFFNNKQYAAVKVEKMYKKLGYWFKGQMILWFFIWIVSFIGLTIVNFYLASRGLNTIENIWVLALIAGITELVPIFWPILWSFPAMLAAWAVAGWHWTFVVAILYIIIQQLENNFFVPMVMNQALWIRPSLIFVSMLICWNVLWFVWVVIGLPLAVIGSMIYDELYNNRKKPQPQKIAQQNIVIQK